MEVRSTWNPNQAAVTNVWVWGTQKLGWLLVDCMNNYHLILVYCALFIFGSSLADYTSARLLWGSLSAQKKRSFLLNISEVQSRPNGRPETCPFKLCPLAGSSQKPNLCRLWQPCWKKTKTLGMGSTFNTPNFHGVPNFQGTNIQRIHGLPSGKLT